MVKKLLVDPENDWVFTGGCNGSLSSGSSSMGWIWGELEFGSVTERRRIIVDILRRRDRIASLISLIEYQQCTTAAFWLIICRDMRFVIGHFQSYRIDRKYLNHPKTTHAFCCFLINESEGDYIRLVHSNTTGDNIELIAYRN